MNEVTLPHVYLPFAQAYEGGIVFLVVETAGDPGLQVERVRQTLVSADPDFCTYGVSVIRSTRRSGRRASNCGCLGFSGGSHWCSRRSECTASWRTT
jgi:hypothetical protein